MPPPARSERSVRDTSTSAPTAALRQRRVPVRATPVTVRYARGEIDVAGDACDKLVRRLRHLAGASPIIAKLEAAKPAQPVELTASEKGFLVIAVKAWMESAGRDRVPNPVIRLREALLGDLFYPTDDVDDGPVPEEPSEPEPAARPADPAPVAAAADVEARASLLRLQDAIAASLAALERAAAEVEAALERHHVSQNT